MVNFTPLSSTVGGLLIGLSVAVMLLGLGRIAGVSGIFGGLVVPKHGDLAWRSAFVGGLIAGGFAIARVAPGWFEIAESASRSLPVTALAGLIVGVGTRMGNGCTSGHGVCGIGRGSPRSIAATVTFLTTGALTVYLTRHALGVLS